eukprot:668822_1
MALPKLWTCHHCCLDNPGHRSQCLACFSKKVDIPSSVHESVYLPHMTLQEASALCVHDKIDHRLPLGHFSLSVVKEIVETNLRIHYIGWPDEYDVWSNYKHRLDRFAQPNSISKRPAHRLHHLTLGDPVSINPITQHPGWRRGFITLMNGRSITDIASKVTTSINLATYGQIRVSYQHQQTTFYYWTHLDNDLEIREMQKYLSDGNDSTDYKSSDSSHSAELQCDPTRTTLCEMGFTETYIEKALKIYEQSHGIGNDYNVGAITELIINLQAKDQSTEQKTIVDEEQPNTNDNRSSQSMDGMKTNATHHTVSTLREHGVLTKKQSLKHLRDATEQIVMGQGKSNTDDHRNSESMDSMKTNATQLIVSILRKHGGVLTKKQLHKHIRKNNGGIHWSNSNFNAELGHLKKFLMQQKNIFLVVPETKSKNFKVTLRDTSDAEQSSDRQPASKFQNCAPE